MKSDENRMNADTSIGWNIIFRPYLKLIRFFSVKIQFPGLWNLPAEVGSEYCYQGKQTGRGIEED